MNQKDITIVDKGKIFPFLYIDNWYTPEEERLIWKELDFYTSCTQLERAEKTSGTATKGGVPLSHAYRIYLEYIYTPKGFIYSHIKQTEKKFTNPDLHRIIEDAMPQGVVYRGTNNGSTFVSYYEEGDYYKRHFDDGQFTHLIWFYRKPKCYSGGELKFPDSNQTVEALHNRCLIFPGYYGHMATPLKWIKKPKKPGQGRYTITTFFSTVWRD